MLEHLVGFSRALHDAGLTVNPGNLLDLCQCFEHIDITRRDDFHAAARATLVSRHEDILRFDAVFARFWEAPESIVIRKHKEGNEESEDQDEPTPGARLLLPSDEGVERSATSRSSWPTAPTKRWPGTTSARWLIPTSNAPSG